jgi:hypothetical protein
MVLSLRDGSGAGTASMRTGSLNMTIHEKQALYN